VGLRLPLVLDGREVEIQIRKLPTPNIPTPNVERIGIWELEFGS
jgi:hypothetical protein